jgi:hypothetical protein
MSLQEGDQSISSTPFFINYIFNCFLKDFKKFKLNVSFKCFFSVRKLGFSSKSRKMRTWAGVGRSVERGCPGEARG